MAAHSRHSTQGGSSGTREAFGTPEDGLTLYERKRNERKLELTKELEKVLQTSGIDLDEGLTAVMLGREAEKHAEVEKTSRTLVRESRSRSSSASVALGEVQRRRSARNVKSKDGEPPEGEDELRSVVKKVRFLLCPSTSEVGNYFCISEKQERVHVSSVFTYLLHTVL
jgi:hypothetical protein